jgi:hypothetical protein
MMDRRDRLPTAEEDFLRRTLGESLAGRAAGQSAQQRADALRAEAPVRTLLNRIFGVHSDQAAWARGARGESVVGRQLARLPTGWWVLNDVPVGHRGANIDHVVIGPGGVFTLNTKNLSGKAWVASRAFMVNGKHTDYLRKARSEAERASRLLSSAVGSSARAHAVLVVMAPRLTVKELPEDVGIVSASKVVAWLTAQPTRLSPDQVVTIMVAADAPATWAPPDAVPSPPPQALEVAQSTPPTAVPHRAISAPPLQSELPSRCACGGELVLRHRRADGAPFYGCSEFPRCRRTQPAPHT